MNRKPISARTDEQLMALISRGQESAFNELYQRYGQKLYAYFYRMLGHDEPLAEDFTQQLFIKIIEKPEHFDTSRRFSTWIYTVAGNMIKNEYRRRNRHPASIALAAEHHPAITEDLWQGIDQPQWRAFLTQAIARLQPKHREVFVLRYQQEHSIQEISLIIGCPEGTVKSRLHYATRYLAEQLADVNPLK